MSPRRAGLLPVLSSTPASGPGYGMISSELASDAQTLSFGGRPIEFVGFLSRDATAARQGVNSAVASYNY